MGRVEKAYLLLYTPPKHEQAVLYHVARVTLSDLRHVFKMHLTSFQRFTVNFINSLFRKS